MMNAGDWYTLCRVVLICYFCFALRYFALYYTISFLYEFLPRSVLLRSMIICSIVYHIVLFYIVLYSIIVVHRVIVYWFITVWNFDFYFICIGFITNIVRIFLFWFYFLFYSGTSMWILVIKKWQQHFNTGHKKVKVFLIKQD